ncbi:eCIS core domain-containing protein [Cellulomonas palmilytica]|uniref:eCIS core domain-containing protein n=1 Tax=Cellulomonas palmilytica TaxID=2608402 RepID=UPI001F41C6CD|nr:DUF4157 domain-containing protein [Cellulomonas palmilytica]UJP39734.1 DUF4157 domain-containing protein [Cellulomonas palmilytica]
MTELDHEHRDTLDRRADDQPTPSAVLRPAPVPLVVGDAHDDAERRADEHAAEALSRLPPLAAPAAPGHLRRATAPTAPAVPTVPAVPTAPTVGMGASGGLTDPTTTRALTAPHGGHALPAPTRARLERGFGADLGHVRLHDGAPAAALARTLGAEAFTVGADVWLGAGVAAPDTAPGEHVLAHEVAHVLAEGGGGPLRRTRAGYKKAYDEAFFDSDGPGRGYWEGFRDGLDELVAEKVLQRNQVAGIVGTHARGAIVYPAGWDREFHLHDDDETHEEEGQSAGWGCGYDIGFEDARTRYGYARHYQPIPDPDRQLALQDNHGRCVYCDARACADVDHVVPLKVHWMLGGASTDLATRSSQANAMSNLVGACATCNRSKGSKQLRRGWDPPAWGNGQWWPFGPARVTATNSPPPYA